MKQQSWLLSASVALLVVAACTTTTQQEPQNESLSRADRAQNEPPPPPPVEHKPEPKGPEEYRDLSTVQQPRVEPAKPQPQPKPNLAEVDKKAEIAAAADAYVELESRAAAGNVARQKFAPQMAYAPPPAASIACCYPVYQPQPEDTEKYAEIKANPVHRVTETPVSTFSIDVDTGSYANVRRFLKDGQLPPQDAVRVEELINYFDYAYAAPRDTRTPFGVSTEIAATPWNPKTHLLRVGIQGWKPQGERKASNLVFLVDVSGSMNEPNKLPLVKSALKLLTKQLTREDRISLVVYAGSSGVVLEPTPGNETAKIDSALERLQAGGSTNGGEGINLAYSLAQQAFIKGGNNRVLLATDGDFNVGVTRFESLIDLAEQKRKTGIALTTLGFGTGNYNDQLMEQLADAGDGNYAYVDSLTEAQKVLVDQRDATLFTIARDVKIQIEFNPAAVSEYRLIGYENRMLKREDFNNDKVDAGDIGAGHTVTALYEVALTGSGGQRIEPLRYGKKESSEAGLGNELAYVRLRYKQPEEGVDAASRLIERKVLRSEIAAQPSEGWRLAASVAAFGQILRGGQYTEGFRYTDVAKLAGTARGDDRNGYAGEFLQLVKLAQSLSAQQVSVRERSD